MSSIVQKIISGGQTGADRAALDFAIANRIPHGGWCPAGRVAEDGTIDWRYRLKETPSQSYVQRTEWNVRDSDGTVVFSVASELVGGSKLTCEFAIRHNKPCVHISQRADGEKASDKLREFVQKHGIKILNIAGPRSSTEPGIGDFTKSVLLAVLTK